MANLKNINDVTLLEELSGEEYIIVVKDGSLHRISKKNTLFGEEALKGVAIIRNNDSQNIEAVALIGYDPYYVDGYYLDEIRSSKMLEDIISEAELLKAYQSGRDVVLELYEENSSGFLKKTRKYKTILQVLASSGEEKSFSSSDSLDGKKLNTVFASKENVATLLA